MPTATAPITSTSIAKAEAAVLRRTQRRNDDRARAAASDREWYAEIHDASQAGVTYMRLVELTEMSKSRIDTIIRAEKARRVKEARAAKGKR